MTRSVRVLLGAAALAVTLVVSGCGGPPSAGAAAVVGDRRISVAELQDATHEIRIWVGPDKPVAERQVLSLLIAAPFLIAAAAGQGVGISTNEASAAFHPQVAAPSDAAVEVVRANAAFGAIGNLDAAKKDAVVKDLQAALANAKITVNPRYGSFDPTTLAITEATPNWLVPAPSPSPSASAEPAPAPS